MNEQMIEHAHKRSGEGLFAPNHRIVCSSFAQIITTADHKIKNNKFAIFKDKFINFIGNIGHLDSLESVCWKDDSWMMIYEKSIHCSRFAIRFHFGIDK